MNTPTDYSGGANARQRNIRRHMRMVQAVEDAIDALGRLRAEGHDIDSLPAALNDARTALHRAHDHLLKTTPVVSVSEFFELHAESAR